MASTQAMPQPTSWLSTCAAVAIHQAERLHCAGRILQAVVDRAGGENAGQSAPSVPPAPCTPKASSESS